MFDWLTVATSAAASDMASWMAVVMYLTRSTVVGLRAGGDHTLLGIMKRVDQESASVCCRSSSVTVNAAAAAALARWK
jgi:hypothetical protein